eukprot:762922-Hanusia_phi.AAC.3
MSDKKVVCVGAKSFFVLVACIGRSVMTVTGYLRCLWIRMVEAAGGNRAGMDVLKSDVCTERP